MAKRVSIAVCLTLGAAFLVGAGCSSIPDHRNVLSGSSGDAGVAPPDGGQTGGFTGGGGSGTGAVGAGGASGSNAGGAGVGGKGNGGKGNGGATSGGGTTSNGGSGNGGQTMSSVDGGPDGGAVGLPCGTHHCQDRIVGRTTYLACCAGPNQDRCGLDTSVDNGPGCVEPDQPGVLDSVCADMETADASANYYGCCRPEGKCGVEFQWPGGPNFGCIDPTEIGLSAGKDCTPAACTAAGKACATNGECCPGPAGDPVCAKFKSATGVCTDHCLWNRDCASGCCIALVNGRGACAPDATACSATCRQLDETCDSDADCCSPNVCAPNGDAGPRLCRPKCTTSATCSPEYCVKDEAGRGACTTSHAGLCVDSCVKAKNGVCNDGGDVDASSGCALGTDCDDCGPRVGGTSLCLDTCTTHGNKKCEDGGPGAASGACAFGTDCSDCGPRLGLCSDACGDAKSGTCDDGGPGHDFDTCSLGSDCTDCGVRWIGRDQKVNNQEPCDGSTGYLCLPEGQSDYISNGNADCPACAWDAAATKVANKCNGTTLGACCAPNNPCKLPVGDGICACFGWCDWEQPDCGDTFPPPLCDFFSLTNGCDLKDPDPTFMNNGKCDCFGACSWENAECKTVLGVQICTDTCKSADDDTCDDTTKCAWGTDCADCGPRFPKTVQ